MAERTFTEEQVQSLLRRATELHLMEDGDQPGLTLKDIEHIAADAGIPPKFLRAALHEADHQVSTRNNSGHTRTHVFVERTVPGELTDEEWESVVFKLRKEYGNDLAGAYGLGPQYGLGLTESLGNAREWRHTTTSGVVSTFTIRSAEGNQHIAFQRRVGMSSPRVEGVAYGLIAALVAATVGGLITQSLLWVVLIFMAALAMAAPTIERLDRRWRNGKLANMEKVADEIAQLVVNRTDEEAAEHEGNAHDVQRREGGRQGAASGQTSGQRASQTSGQASGSTPDIDLQDSEPDGHNVVQPQRLRTRS